MSTENPIEAPEAGWMDSKETAKYIGGTTHHKVVERWARKKQLRSARTPGGQYRFLKEWVDNDLKRRGFDGTVRARRSA